jgi:hypothetical protein
VPEPPEPWLDDVEPDYVPGVHELTVLAEPARLAEAIHYIRTSHVVLAGASGPFQPGRLLMLGGPGWDTFEIVRVRDAIPAPQQMPQYKVERGVLGTVGGPHPVGTPVTLVSAETQPAGLDEHDGASASPWP